MPESGVLAEIREHGVPFSWVLTFLVVVAAVFFTGFVLGLGQKSSDYQRGLEDGFRMALGHPELQKEQAKANAR